MAIPSELKYTEEHEWVRMDGDIAIVGVTDHAQEELSDVVFVELPELEREVEEKEQMAVVESVKAASDIYAPVSGTIIEVNVALEEEPGLVNEDPYGEGWLFKIRVSDMEIVEGLLTADDYEEHIG
ncbi:glycine cleavage system protein GcvH [Roseibacillus persicicus]|uniref:Glycine cleavage system H protein n=1 Tax=Roseibacillus persicicus TaxID=454148 RepID=A0A918TYL7_9BACT|nr:glycine cleavage system protein GcvH [Roseibacillus persicicus]MDQ8190200.1 glycine cleavage system protein GcvH [Roseibacillus persicicus]GHC66083.1 glycine cleavage system H protein [Roseibacillus persicicus]